MKVYKSTFLNGIMALLVLYLTSCGTILYPERKGQKSGKIDVAVAVLDAVGLLCFVIPGVIAFVVDYNNGTIYLPPGRKNIISIKSPSDLDKMMAIKTGNKHLTDGDIELTIKKHTGKSIDLSRPDVIVKRFDDETNDRELSVAMGDGIKY